jgi:hypothetical protein
VACAWLGIVHTPQRISRLSLRHRMPQRVRGVRAGWPLRSLTAPAAGYTDAKSTVACRM